MFVDEWYGNEIWHRRWHLATYSSSLDCFLLFCEFKCGGWHATFNSLITFSLLEYSNDVTAFPSRSELAFVPDCLQYDRNRKSHTADITTRLRLWRSSSVGVLCKKQTNKQTKNIKSNQIKSTRKNKKQIQANVNELIVWTAFHN